MNSADQQYLALVRDVLENGYYDNNRTGIPTKKLFGRSFQFDLQQEFPILTTKQVFFKTALKELFWIYVYQSNDVRKLHEMGVTVWDEWAREDHTIGKAYGYQVRKHRQIDKLIEGLIHNPQGRRHIISLWDLADLEEMALQPCAFMTMWDVSDGYLNCTLVQRSADLGLGVPFNFTQYAVLVHMIAHVTGLKPGKFVHYLNNAHIYENHFEPIKQQLERTPFPAPTLWINPEVKDFYQFTPDDIRLIGYQHHPKIEMEVAV
ncbi:thymidylate synthase [Brevibacillus fulvus]|uniref:Thymidylate synthase n=1 Tax=Brevibacillus fulvus TaxID=1125967 RepID=A0A938XY69_9BACL|nr:thymidylate synthase [Brevibacillus fulvus]MBM7588621.1 thymidylate synthase [Brevibacillus fulvus]